ncbi:MAG TPA: hypothetical protein VF158_02870 [Longimicrobiales bacterium]
MSLIPFHKGLISTGIAFCAGFSVWTFLAYRRGGGPATLLLAAVFALLAIALAVYLRHLRRILGIPGRPADDGVTETRRA